ncbi:MAG: hypothetical protein ABJG68_07480 [Crocinitomicaceae bacterium]
MNTYNDNLRSNVVDSLNEQELERKKMEAQMNASKFTLYYAQGATISDAEKLALAEDKASIKGKVKKEAVVCSNLSINVLASAKQQKTLSDLSVTNMSVSASNVQIATNAVVKLASDMGSISSIISAADYGTDIHELCITTKGYMDTTASHAEIVSQYSMEASALMAEVSSTHVETQATSTNSAIQNLLKIAASEFQGAYDLVTTDNSKLAAANVKEKVAEGKLEDSNVTYHAAKSAYKLMSRELNLHLRTSHTKFPINTKDEDLNMKVKFNALQSPFSAPNFIQSEQKDTYPIEEYRVYVVKSNKQNTFNIAAAENLYNQDATKTIQRFVGVPAANQKKYEVEIDVSSVSTVRDTDGDKIEFGKNYVVFVFAKYSESYKSEINNFENFLSASSYIFSLTEEVKGPHARDIKVDETIELLEIEADTDLLIHIENGTIGKIDKVEDISWPLKVEKKSFTMRFSLPTDANDNHKVEYRCIFLPADSELTRSLLTKKLLKTIESNDEKVQNIFEFFAKKILNDQNAIDSTESLLQNSTDENEKEELLETLAEQRQKLKKDEMELQDQIDSIQQSKNRSSFDGFSQMVKDLDGSVDAIETRAKIDEEITKYETYNIAAKKVSEFKESLNDPISNLTNYLSNQAEIKSKNSEIKDYNSEIADLQDEIIEEEKTINNDSALQSKKDRALARIESLMKSQKEKKSEIQKIQKEIKKLNTAAKNLETQKTSDVKDLNAKAEIIDSEFQKTVGSLSFYFDLDIAEQVSKANYSLATKGSKSGNNQNWEVVLESNTTDNFGNLLVSGDQYIPLILTYSDAPEVDASKFENRLSDANKTKKFTYEQITVKSDDSE